MACDWEDASKSSSLGPVDGTCVLRIVPWKWQGTFPTPPSMHMRHRSVLAELQVKYSKKARSCSPACHFKRRSMRRAIWWDVLKSSKILLPNLLVYWKLYNSTNVAIRWDDLLQNQLLEDYLFVGSTVMKHVKAVFCHVRAVVWHDAKLKRQEVKHGPSSYSETFHMILRNCTDIWCEDWSIIPILIHVCSFAMTLRSILSTLSSRQVADPALDRAKSNVEERGANSSG